MKKTLFIIFASFLLALNATAQTSAQPQDIAASEQTAQDSRPSNEALKSAPDKESVSPNDAADKHKKNSANGDKKIEHKKTSVLSASDWIAVLLGLAAITISIIGLRQNRISNQKQNRAYLGIKSIKSEKKSLRRPAEAPMKVLITIRNAGVTPARNVKVVYNHVAGTDDIKDKLPPPSKPNKLGSMMPDSENYVEYTTKGPPEWDWLDTQSRIIAGELTYHIYGIIYYDDAFENSWETHFHGFLTKQPIDGTSFAIGSAEKNFIN